jgi:hypothetical protein
MITDFQKQNHGMKNGCSKFEVFMKTSIGGTQLNHEELTSTFGNDACGPCQIKIWLQRA